MAHKKAGGSSRNGRDSNAKRLGVKLELVPVVASNRIQFLQQGKIDLMIATMSDTPERRKIVDIVDPNYYGSGTNVLAVGSDLNGPTIGAIFTIVGFAAFGFFIEVDGIERQRVGLVLVLAALGDVDADRDRDAAERCAATRGHGDAHHARA